MTVSIAIDAGNECNSDRTRAFTLPGISAASSFKTARVCWHTFEVGVTIGIPEEVMK